MANAAEVYSSRMSSENRDAVEIVVNWEGAPLDVFPGAGDLITAAAPAGLGAWSSAIYADYALFVTPTVADIRNVPHADVGVQRTAVTYRGTRKWA